jgi:outer membrane protein OmpA-like peptidoglycan-associated protein
MSPKISARLKGIAAILPLVLLVTSPAGRAEDLAEVYQKSGTTSWGTLFSSFFPQGAKAHFGKSVAVVIGVSDYAYYSHLDAAESDAVRVRDFLINDEGFDYVVSLTNSRATRQIIDKLMVDDIPELVGPDDRFVFYFSGHGTQRPMPGGGFSGYLPLQFSKPASYSSMISMDDIARWNSLIGDARHVLFVLDACFSGLAGIQLKSDLVDKKLARLSQYGHFLLTAGTKDETSAASMKYWNGSLFTDSLLRGARGAADSSNSETAMDGIVSLKELMNYVGDRIDKESSRLSSTFSSSIKMSPQISELSSDNQGEFFFAMTPSKSGHTMPLSDDSGGSDDPLNGADIVSKGQDTESADVQPVNVPLTPMSKDYSASGDISVYVSPDSTAKQIGSIDSETSFHVSGKVVGQDSWYSIDTSDGTLWGYATLKIPHNQPTQPAMPPAVYIVLFDYDSTKINPAGEAVLNQVISDMTESGATSVSVTGHTDRAGTAEYNFAKSQRMADTVREYMITHGVSADAITTQWKGESENAVPTEDGVKEQANRRVEIIIQ